MSDLAVDACCLLNLLAAGGILPTTEVDFRSETRSVALKAVLHVPATVVSEAMYVLQPDAEDAARLVKSEIDLSILMEAGVLRDCDIQTGEEAELFVQLAVRLDDGEAACLAIAKSRSWALATDDRLARKLADQIEVPTVSTAELVKSWAQSSGASKKEIARILTNIQRFAKFVPRRSSPDSEWWYRHSAPS